jgi:putative peptidoglycan binding protein
MKKRQHKNELVRKSKAGAHHDPPRAAETDSVTTVPDMIAAVSNERIPALHRKALAEQLGSRVGNHNLLQLLATAEKKELDPLKDGAPTPQKDASSRFKGDKSLEKVALGLETLKKGSRGIPVVRLQQALVDMEYVLKKYGVDGIFWKETEAGVKAFQHDATLPETGEFDQATLIAMDKIYDTRKPYLDDNVFDPTNPTEGTRKLRGEEKKAVNDALVPSRGAAGVASTFQDDVGGEKYGDAIRDHLGKLIKALHKELFEDKEPLRADPKKNFHDWSVLEKTAAASKDVTDAVYGSYAKGPPMTEAAGNFVDQWEDEIARNKNLKDDEKKDKARGKVDYLINSNCTTINDRHSAVPSDVKEKAILTPIIESFVDTPAKVQILLELDIGWEGAQLQGVVYLQRYKKDTDDKNREQLWELFHTCIHEYIHSLAHPAYQAYAEKFRAKGDETRYNTLIEGFDDFFTENVRQTVKINDKLRQEVEGPYYDSKAAVPKVNPSTYPSKAQAERVVSIVGIRNAQGAYFQGLIKLIGG